MSEKSILYKLKAVDKIVVRKLVGNLCLSGKDIELKNVPSPSQMEIIEYILKHIDEDIYQKDLEEVLNLRRATISGILQTMEKNGFIKRVTDEYDTRTKKIILDEKAKSMYLERCKELQKLEKAALDGISEDELKVFYDVLDKVKTNLINKTEERRNDD